MKADRLLSVLLLLQGRGRATERELAERLEVSQRTIHRDLEALSAAGVPVLALRGATGGWQLEKGWRTQVPGLNQPELQALLMAQPRVLGHPRLVAAAESALNKLMASLPGPMREEAAMMRERLHVDPRGWWDAGEDVSVLPLLQDAVAQQRRLSFDYVRADGQQGSRTVEPLGLVVKGSVWYLVARTPKGLRTFRVSRIREAVVLAEKFDPPTRFSLADYWARTTAEIEQRQKQFIVALALAPDAAQRLRSHIPTTPLKSSAAKHLPDDWIELQAAFDDEAQARFVVMGIGARARVLSPEHFRQSIVAEARIIAGLDTVQRAK
jgi:predicted DNA-binding transcriptional regulator YafY